MVAQLTNFDIGPDGIPGYIIKGCAEYLEKQLCDVFNIRIKQRVCMACVQIRFLIIAGCQSYQLR